MLPRTQLSGWTQLPSGHRAPCLVQGAHIALLPCTLQTGDYYVAAARRWDSNLVARDSNMFRKYVQFFYFYIGVRVGTWAQLLIKKRADGKKGIIQALNIEQGK